MNLAELLRMDADAKCGRIGEAKLRSFVDNRASGMLKEDAIRIIAECRKKDVQIITRDDEAYPERFQGLPDIPAVLYAAGVLKINQYAASVGVVGARRCTQEEKQIAIEKVETEVAGGAAIVSGMAKGIDAYAHTAALLNHGYTIAVLGNGPDICYPKEHETLYEEIIKEGCVLSEYRPGITPHRHLFPQRNRLIAALSDRLYVIGAGRHSGTESTVESARKYRRRVEENGACHH